MSRTTDTTRKPRSLAARMGRWSANHWKTATFGWLALVVVAFGIGGMAGMKNPDPNTAGPGESGRMDRILHEGFKRPAGENVLIQSGTATAGAPAFDAAVKDVVARVSREADARNVRSPLAPGNSDQISKDRHSALVGFDVRGEVDKAPDKVGPIVDAVAAAQAAHPGFFIGEMGDASAPKAVMDQQDKDLAKAGELSLPITLIILIVTFGALVAAGIPLLLALTAVFGTFGLVSIASHVLPMAAETQPLVLLIGLAVGVDYSMFYLRREREERAKGRSERAALEVAAATSGRSVLISGLTVMAAMAGMFVTGDEQFASFGVATMMVVAVAMLGSLTVLPALLSRLGDKVDRFRVRRRSRNDSRMWGWVADRVLRRPALAAAIAGGLLLLLALPALQMRMAEASPDTFPAHLEVVKTYKRMQQAFPGTALPANVIVKAPNVNAPAVREAISRLERLALASGRAHEPITMAVNRAGTVANITIPIDGAGSDKASNASLKLLRQTVIPETVGKLPGTEAGVTGLTAQWKDSGDQFRSVLPLVVAFVLVFAFALMLVAFRSIVVAVKAIVLNCLSVAAAYGILVLVFQHGIGKGLLGFTDTTGVSPVIPLLLFVILFGLSMDYHVFIVSRIRERFQRGATMDEAISDGIRSTGSVVTSAAVVMVCVFAVFATLSMLFFKQFGVGLAAAILIDATIVRGVLLPATMKLLGARNWYLPSWLEWLPHFDHGELEVLDELEQEPERTRAPKPKRRLGFARITGLLLIAILALGLAYVKASSGGGTVSVPAGAKAGQLTLHPCRYGTEQGSYAADCGTLVVAENRARPGSRLIALPVTRIEARSAHPGAPVFRLEGGPGISNMHFAKASRIAGNHDVVLVGYRGVDGSVRLDCPEVESALKRVEDILGPKSMRAYAEAFRSCAARLRAGGVDLDGYGLPQRVDDLEAARKALGYERIDLLSESAGTRTAMLYAWRFPRTIRRSVMIGVNPPGHFLWHPQTTDQQIRRYARLCAGDESCSRRTDDFAATLKRTFADPPHRFWGLPISKGDVREAAFWGLNESTSEAAPLSAPMTVEAWLSAAEGDPSGLWFESLFARLAFPTSFVWGEMAAASRLDAQASDRYYASRRPDSIIGNPGSDFLFARGALMRAWPANPTENDFTRVRDSAVPTLLVGGELDLATPPQVAARELLPHLSNGHQVVLRGFGHTTTFWNEQPEASERLLNAFLDEGRVDTSLYVPGKVDFTPEITQTALGKGFAATIMALPAIVVLSLLLLWRRSRRRGRIGRPASALLRSVFTLVLGLGGWFAGLLVAFFAFPALPLDDAVLAVVSIGVPIGLGIYLGWVDRAKGGRAVGLTAALAGALAGAWLGYNAGTGLLAVVTTIVGAALGANLAVLVLDVSRDRQARDRIVDAVPAEALEARPSAG
jgi:uncharacterized membrane protein YdfJ with MMPL/SSD domain/pimeloyl-ACP methyl ester carboxylesterase